MITGFQAAATTAAACSTAVGSGAIRVGTLAAPAGGSLYLIGKVLGHRQRRTTEIYAHLADDSLRVLASETAGSISSAMGE